jgi:hypothetical protein
VQGTKTDEPVFNGLSTFEADIGRGIVLGPMFEANRSEANLFRG